MADAPRPRVILLNGTPSAGKSATADALRPLLPGDFLRVSVDDFIAMHPDRSRLADLVPAEDGGVRIALRPEGHRLMRGFHRAVAALVAAGHGVVVDDVFLDAEVATDWRAALEGVPVLLVGVRCALEECERRERGRSERTPGLARGHFDIAHEGVTYDLDVWTDRQSPQEAAVAIRERWGASTPPSGFALIRVPAG